MSGLASISTIPPTPNGLKEWALAHAQHHQAIIDAARQTGKGNLTLYQIYPINPADLAGWSLQHQQQHNDMLGLYGIPGSDLSDINFSSERAVAAFIWENLIEHRAVAQACGVPI